MNIRCNWNFCLVYTIWFKSTLIVHEAINFDSGNINFQNYRAYALLFFIFPQLYSVFYLPGWEIIIGGFLVLGTAGVTAISLVLTFVYVCLFFAIRYCIKKLRKRQAQVVVIDIGDKSGADTNAPPPGKGGLLDTSLALMAAKMASAKMAAMSFINKLRGQLKPRLLPTKAGYHRRQCRLRQKRLKRAMIRLEVKAKTKSKKRTKHHCLAQ